MNILNAKYKTQPMKWDSITFPLLQGTPVNADGEISNDEDAIGMVTETFVEKPLLPALSIVIAGDVEEKEIVYELSDAAVAAMSGIRIYNEDGSREGSGGGGGSSYLTANIYFWAGSGENTDVPSSFMKKMQIQYKEGWTWGDVVESFNNFPLICAYGNMYPLMDVSSDKIVFNVISSWGGADVCSLWIGDNTDEATRVETTDLVSGEVTYFFYKYNDPECLKAGTQIAVEGATVDVMDIKSGQEVLTLDPETLKVKTAKVAEVKLDTINEHQKITDRWYNYKFDDGSEIHLVGRHRFWNMEKNKFEWMHKWEIGDHAFKIDGSMPAYVGMEVIEEKTEWNTFWNEGKACYFADGFLSGNITSPVPKIEVEA